MLGLYDKFPIILLIRQGYFMNVLMAAANRCIPYGATSFYFFTRAHLEVKIMLFYLLLDKILICIEIQTLLNSNQISLLEEEFLILY